jgi:hypothetical protein
MCGRRQNAARRVGAGFDGELHEIVGIPPLT